MSPDGLRQIFNFCLVVSDLCYQGNHSIHRWPDVTPQIALCSKRNGLSRNKTNSSIKPNKFHSIYVCFGGRKTREEQKICLKTRLFGFPQRFVMGSATTAARKVVSSSTLIGPFKYLSARSNLTATRPHAQIQTGSLGCVARNKNVTGC